VSINIQSLDKDPVISNFFTGKLAGALDKLLGEEGLSSGELNVVIAGDDMLQRLNREYRGKDVPTDVLSFSYLDQGGLPSSPAVDYAIGDIYISIDRARIQAEEAGHSLKKEVALLAIHGLLHLIGYNHGTETDAGKMREKEKEILEALERRPAGDE